MKTVTKDGTRYLMDLQTIKSVDLKSVGAVVGLIVGILGLLYGWYKDRKLRAIEKRGKAPFFAFHHFQIDAKSTYDAYGQLLHYIYPDPPKILCQDLFAMPSSVEDIPDDYPNGRILGVVVKNHGAVLRVFKTACAEKGFLFRSCTADTTCYELRYRFYRADQGKPLTFNIWFEVESGFRGKQTWQVEKGTSRLKRLRPKSV